MFATHGIFSGPCAQILLESPNLEKVSMLTINHHYYALYPMRQLVVTNSLPQDTNLTKMGNKMEVVDVSGTSLSLKKEHHAIWSGMVSEFIRRSHYNESVSVLSHYVAEKDSNKTRKISSESEVEEDFSHLNIEPPTQRLRKGFRLESVCWD